jgi:hypothetical protein
MGHAEYALPILPEFQFAYLMCLPYNLLPFKNILMAGADIPSVVPRGTYSKTI